MLLQIHEPGEAPAPHESRIAVGIDLGTTHSVISYIDGERAVVIEDAAGNRLHPSVVSYAGDAPVAGHAALADLQAIHSIKRLMTDNAEDRARFDIADGEGMPRLNTAKGPKTPVEVSAEILRHLKQLAEDALGRQVEQAVITVPAHFDEAARQATKDAARLAGLEVLRLINEPTAAALAYGLDEGAEGLYAIYDLGGGTFDISILRLQQGVFQVLATGGDTRLGGDDFDRLLSQKLGVGMLEARRIKEALSDGEQPQVTRVEFEALIAPLVSRSLSIAEEMMDEAELDVSELQGVVLVGGSTRVPLVRREVERFFGRTAEAGVDPDEVVAVGAARQAHNLTQGGDHLLLDVVPLSLGLETMGGLMERVIHRNTPIPTSATQEFTTYQDGQSAMLIHVLQGERELVANCRSLGRFELRGIPPLPAGIARIAVTFTIDADGMLEVAAEEKLTGIQQQIAVKPSYGITPEEMGRMLMESMSHAKEDITARLLQEARVEAERSIIELESALKVDGSLLSGDERLAMEGLVAELRVEIAGDDRDAIDFAAQELHQKTEFFAQRRMDKAVANALQGRGIDELETNAANG